MREAAIKIQSAVRRYNAQNLAKRRRRGILVIQSWWRMVKERKWYHALQRDVVGVQAWWRGRSQYLKFNRSRLGARRIEKAYISFLRKDLISEWIQEIHAACSWGETKEVCPCKSPPVYHPKPPLTSCFTVAAAPVHLLPFRLLL